MLSKTKKRKSSLFDYPTKSKCNKNPCDLNTISKRGFIFLISLTLSFQISSLLGLVPTSLISKPELINTQAFFLSSILSIVLNFFFMIVVFAKLKLLPIRFSEKFMTKTIWFMIIAFSVSSIAQLLLGNTLERYILAPISFMLGYFSLMILINKDIESSQNSNTSI